MRSNVLRVAGITLVVLGVSLPAMAFTPPAGLAPTPQQQAQMQQRNAELKQKIADYKAKNPTATDYAACVAVVGSLTTPAVKSGPPGMSNPQAECNSQAGSPMLEMNRQRQEAEKARQNTLQGAQSVGKVPTGTPAK